MNIFNSLLAQLVKYDVHTTRKINSIHAIFYHILSFSSPCCMVRHFPVLHFSASFPAIMAARRNSRVPRRPQSRCSTPPFWSAAYSADQNGRWPIRPRAKPISLES